VNLLARRQALAGAAEAALVALAAGGEVEAYEELVRRREPRLRQFLRRVCADAALADDLAQQSFLQAWMQLGSLREPAAFGSWLRQLALNCALQQLRRRRELLDPDAGIDVPADGVDPGLALDLERSLARLRPDERVCVVLCHAEGMSHAEIAAHTGWPLGTVKSHVTRGSARLRAWLDPGVLEAP
jgi:RNA polymerase sigma-70 factor (ECF subfamily)